MTFGSPASVIAAIREDAEAEVERLRTAEEAEIAAIRARAGSMSIGVAGTAERLAAARRNGEQTIAAQEWEGRRTIIEQRETWIGEVVLRARERWDAEPPSRRRDILLALIDEARSRFPAGPCEIAVNDRDQSLIDLRDATITSAAISGGCIVSQGDVSFDNSFEARARRFESEWRSALSGVYKP
jgi:vacuolar-type H+-ATPase subunit E/Vma4